MWGQMPPAQGDAAEPAKVAYLPLRKRLPEKLMDREALGKVPQVTLLFWVAKIIATTLGETAGDAVTMSMNLGYLVGTAIFAVFFLVAVSGQIAARRFHAALFWTVIVATTTVGTTMADFCDRSLGIGYAGGASLLAALLA